MRLQGSNHTRQQNIENPLSGERAHGEPAFAAPTAPGCLCLPLWERQRQYRSTGARCTVTGLTKVLLCRSDGEAGVHGTEERSLPMVEHGSTARTDRPVRGRSRGPRHGRAEPSDGGARVHGTDRGTRPRAELAYSTGPRYGWGPQQPTSKPIPMRETPQRGTPAIRVPCIHQGPVIPLTP
jgi:hypothetical protein